MSGTPPAMCSVRRLRLFQFRNYDEAIVELLPGVNVFSGANAQGKSNLLEAVATLALTRSPRAPSSDALLRWGALQALVEGVVAQPAGLRTLAVRFERDQDGGRVQRTTTLDGNRSTPGAVLGLCPVVLFWPDELQLVKAGPDGRRRTLDLVLSQLDRGMSHTLVRYRRVLEQRNALLKQLRLGGGAGALPSFTRELTELGGVIEVARARLVRRLGELAAGAMADLTETREQLQLRYAPHRGEAVDDPEEAAGLLEQALHDRGAEELARGVTLAGPHRDDMEVILDGKPARLSASQGQQRTAVLALKIAEVDYFCERTSVAPIVILDDVLSELDPTRRHDLVRLLAGRAPLQVLLTTAEPLGELQHLNVARHFIVRQGRVSPA
jgi:DNA replication and repair protein RecF